MGLVIITFYNVSYGLWIPSSPEELLEQSETVFVGTITSVNVLEFERSNTYDVEKNGVSRTIIENFTQNLDEYTVNIEEFLKNPQKSQTITMLEATVGGVPGLSVSIGGFDMGDRVLFYVPKIDGENQYSPESFKIPKSCNAKTVLSSPKLTLTDDFYITQDNMRLVGNFTAGKPMQFVYDMDTGTLDGKGFDLSVAIYKTNSENSHTDGFNKIIHAESKPCEWIASAKWEFTPQPGQYSMNLSVIKDNTGQMFSGSSFSVLSDPEMHTKTKTNTSEEKSNKISYYDFRNSDASVDLGCSGAGMSSKESCEIQRAQLIGLIGITIAALISIPVVLFNRKGK